MKTLQQLQEAAREKFDKEFGDCKLGTTPERQEAHEREIKQFLNQLIASTIEEVRKAMMLEAGGNITIEGMLMNEAGISGWNACRAEINRRFTELTSEQKGICK